MTLTVKRIPAEYVHQRWNEVAPFIDSALKYAEDDYNLDQVKVFVTSNTWLLLAVCDNNDVVQGAITVSFSNLPNARIAYITTIGGKNIITPESYKQFASILKQFGATKVQGGARESVARLWRRLGFRVRYSIVENTL